MTDNPATLVEFRPREALLFRDARPFNAGHQVTARGQLPEPGTLFGAVRTAALEMACADVRAFGQGRQCSTCTGTPDCRARQVAGPPGSAGAADHPGEIRARGTFLVDGPVPDPRLFCPTPALLTTAGLGAQRRLALATPEPLGPGERAWNCILPEVALPSTLGAPFPDPEKLPLWIPVTDLAALLRGAFPDRATWPAWAAPKGPLPGRDPRRPVPGARQPGGDRPDALPGRVPALPPRCAHRCRGHGRAGRGGRPTWRPG